MKMRQKLAEASGIVALGDKGEPPLEVLSDFWYNRGIQDTIELLLPDVISMRKVREWLKDWALSMPIDDLEAFTGTLK
jgi:hypothetical protein